MTSFATLPAEAKRALARRELRRRGVTIQQFEDASAWFDQHAPEAVAAFDRIEELSAANGHTHEDAWPADQRDEAERLFSLAVRAMRAVGGPPEPMLTTEQQEARRLSLAEKLEAAATA